MIESLYVASGNAVCLTSDVRTRQAADHRDL